MSSSSSFVIEPRWVKPFFKKGYTEYSVIRKTVSQYASGRTYNAYETVGREVLFKTTDVDEAVSFRDELNKKELL